MNIWKQVLGADLLVRSRLSRIYYRSKFFHYPLEPMNALIGLGPAEALRCITSFLRSRLAPALPEDDLETWISNRFGRRLFQVFFKGYTEKVWGMPCNQISAEWGDALPAFGSHTVLAHLLMIHSNKSMPRMYLSISITKGNWSRR